MNSRQQVDQAFLHALLAPRNPHHAPKKPFDLSHYGLCSTRQIYCWTSADRDTSAQTRTWTFLRSTKRSAKNEMILIVYYLLYINIYLMVMLMCYSYYVVPDDSDAFKNLFSRGGEPLSVGTRPIKYARRWKAADIRKGSFCSLIVFRFLFIGHLRSENPHGTSQCSSIEPMDAL